MGQRYSGTEYPEQEHHIYPDNRVTLSILGGTRLSPVLVCHELLQRAAKDYVLDLIWIKDRLAKFGNEAADAQSRDGSETPVMVLEPIDTLALAKLNVILVNVLKETMNANG